MALDVWLRGARVGRLMEQGASLSFQYDEAALDEPRTSRLSVRLAVRKDPYEHLETAAFFDNLLPEEDVRAALAETTRFGANDTVALLGAVGGECAGAVSLWPENVSPPPPPPLYVPCMPSDVHALTGRDSEGATALELRDGRQVMSGAQPKLVLLRRGDAYSLPRAGSPTTVLVKRDRPRFPGLMHNEQLAMRLMAAAQVPVAMPQKCALDTRLYECVRYDRVDSGSTVKRLHQEDFCQATGRLPRAKYAFNGGPTMREVKTLLDRHSVDALTDVDLLARWNVANACLGNFDAHAKNLSLLTQNDATRLAPAYDVVCTAVYPALNKKFALTMGGTEALGSLTRQTGAKFARELQLAEPQLRMLASDVADRLLSALESEAHSVATEFGDHEVLTKVVEWTRVTAPVVRAALGS